MQDSTSSRKRKSDGKSSTKNTANGSSSQSDKVKDASTYKPVKKVRTSDKGGDAEAQEVQIVASLKSIAASVEKGNELNQSLGTTLATLTVQMGALINFQMGGVPAAPAPPPQSTHATNTSSAVEFDTGREQH
jgi:hypothetical protein